MPDPIKYTANDGTQYDTQYQASEHDRKTELAHALGYTGSFGAPAQKYYSTGGYPAAGAYTYTDPFQQWLSADPTRQQAWKNYYDTGLTAADYRAEQQQKQQEADRKAAVAQGQQNINSAFSGFDPSYYNGIQQAYLDYYTPQLKDQYGQAQKSLTYDLARHGQLDSSAANTRESQLSKQYGLQLGKITNNAADAVNTQRTNVENQKNSLLDFNNSAADANAVSTRAGGVTDNLKSWAPQLSPLGQVFYDFVTPVSNTLASGISAQRQGYPGFSGVFNPGYSSKSTGSYNQVNG
ncbi:MAG TPA: hypothetical protein VKA19_01255 [Alphaproteobacteria bacterium]|nr:hypothetical protein [Alphaproteobacteria bacterium]